MTLYSMSKSNLTQLIAEKVKKPEQELKDIEKEVKEILKNFIQVVIEKLKDGQEVNLTGFGTFSARHRSARMGVNIKNPAEKIQMPAIRVAKFKAGKRLKDGLKKKESSLSKPQAEDSTLEQ